VFPLSIAVEAVVGEDDAFDDDAVATAGPLDEGAEAEAEDEEDDDDEEEEEDEEERDMVSFSDREIVCLFVYWFVWRKGSFQIHCSTIPLLLWRLSTSSILPPYYIPCTSSTSKDPSTSTGSFVTRPENDKTQRELHAHLCGTVGGRLRRDVVALVLLFPLWGNTPRRSPDLEWK
jgi:hypothetical protein